MSSSPAQCARSHGESLLPPHLSGGGVEVWSDSANLWVKAEVVSRNGTPGSSEERLVVRYELPGLGVCEKKLQPGSKNLRAAAFAPPARRGAPTEEVDPKAFFIPVDPVQRLEEKFGIGNDVEDQVRDELTEMNEAAVSLLLHEALEGETPDDPEALAWTFAQCNRVMNSRRPMPFKDVFPDLVKRMLDIGELTEFAKMFRQDSLPDSIRSSVGDSEVICIGIVADEGGKLWGQLFSHERRLVAKLVENLSEINVAGEAFDLLHKTKVTFAALKIMHRASHKLDSMLEVLRDAEPESLSSLYKQDRRAGRDAMRTLIMIRGRQCAHGAERLTEITSVMEPMLTKDVWEAYITDPRNDLKKVSEFCISFVSALRSHPELNTSQASDIPFFILKRLLESPSGDQELHRNMALETALLLLEPDKEPAIRRWASNAKNWSSDSVALFSQWSAHYLCAFLQPHMELGLGNAHLGEESLALLKAGKERKRWVHRPQYMYFRSERGIEREDKDLVQVVVTYFKLVSWSSHGRRLIGELVNTLDTGDATVFGPLDHLAPPKSALRQALSKDFVKLFHGVVSPENDLACKTMEGLFGCRSAFDERFVALVKSWASKSTPSFHGCFWDLVSAIGKLLCIRSHDRLEEGVAEIREWLDDLLTRKSLTKLIRRVAAIDDPSFLVDDAGSGTERVVFTFDKLRACGSQLHDCSQSLHGELSTRIMKNFDSALDEILKAAPIAWLPTLRNLESIFIVLKYQGQEDVNTAFAKFRAANTSEEFAEAGFGELLSCVEKIFQKPIVDMAGLDILDDQIDIRQLVTKAAEQLQGSVLWRAQSFEVAFTPEDWALVLDIVVAQLENMRGRMKILMQPHHTQVVCFLMFGFLVCAAAQNGGSIAGKAFKTVLAEIGTGEGKSWVIAMVAAFIAKKGMRAHVLIDNSTLRQRDGAMTMNFFATLGIKMVMADKSDTCLTDAKCQVVYCSAHNIDLMGKHCVQQGREPDAGMQGSTVLIVDEVDGLVIDSTPYVHWVHTDESIAGEFKTWVRARAHQVQVTGLTGESSVGNGTYKKAGKHGARPYFKHDTADMFVYCLEDLRWCLGPSLGAGEGIWAETDGARCNTYLPPAGRWSEAEGTSGSSHFKIGTLDDVKESKMDAYTKCVFQEFRDACNVASTKVRGIDYQVVGKHFYLLDSVTKTIRPNGASMWLEVLKSEADPHHHISFKTVQTVVSKVFCHHTYSHIFGLTGSLGGDAEKQFLKEQYSATTFSVPSFLDSCPNTAGKQRPILREVEHVVQESEAAQIEKVAQIAASSCRSVPVLVLAENPRMRERILEGLRACPEIPEEYKTGDGKGLVEVKLDLSNNDDLVRQVDLATKPITVARGDKKQKSWRVAVTTAEGGRGHDYRVTDVSVDKHGGLLVIITWIPESLRDWTQFKGRTARQDRKGQFAVILNAEGRDLEKVKFQGLTGEDVINELMRASNTKTAKKLDGYSSSIPKAELMQSLSVKFWLTKNEGDVSTEQRRQWIHLCQNYHKMTEIEIEKFWSNNFLGAAGGIDMGETLSPTSATRSSRASSRT